MTSDPSVASGQVVAPAAEVYDAFFVPALFAQWADRMLDLAGVVAGDDVLDVGCGTGVLTRAAARRLQGTGSCTGLDLNPEMLAVARRAPEPVTWCPGRAEALPFESGSFDRVTSQFALMFFDDRASALSEMGRVLRPTGTVTVSTWARIEESPGYEAMAHLLERLHGREVADALLAPFSIGTADTLEALLAAAFDDVSVVPADGRARFDSIDAWVHTDIRGWTLADRISDEQHADLLSAAHRHLAPFAASDGRVEFAAPALIGTGRPRPHRPDR